VPAHVLDQRPLGQGGEGAVYKLILQPSDTFILEKAVKVSYVSTTRTLDLIAYEMELCRMLKGPYFVYPTDIYLSLDLTSASNNLLVWQEMPLIDGHDLEEWSKVRLRAWRNYY
jgi:serine/threonine protein kinase